jgi:hypothetical protein
MQVPDEAVQAALARRADLLSDRPDPMVLSEETLTRRMLEAAAPILAEAWNLPALQAEHEEWQRRGEKARKIHDDFYRQIDDRRPQAAPATREDGPHG